MLQVTKVPNALEFFYGGINLRGKVIPVIDLRLRLSMLLKEDDKNRRIIIIEVGRKTVGFIMDSISEVLRVPKSVTEAPPELVMGINSEYIQSAGKLEARLLNLINFEKILSNEETAQLQNILEEEYA